MKQKIQLGKLVQKLRDIRDLIPSDDQDIWESLNTHVTGLSVLAQQMRQRKQGEDGRRTATTVNSTPGRELSDKGEIKCSFEVTIYRKVS